MIDLLVFISCVFLVVAVGAAIEYYKSLVKARKEYEKAKEAFNDIILSFSRELRHATESLQVISYKVEAASSKSSDAVKSIGGLEAQIRALESKMKEFIEDRERILARLSDVEKQTRDITESNKEILAKVSIIEEKTQKVPVLNELGIETAIPIKREKALAKLTETELAVLEMLAA